MPIFVITGGLISSLLVILLREYEYSTARSYTLCAESESITDRHVSWLIWSW